MSDEDKDPEEKEDVVDVNATLPDGPAAKLAAELREELDEKAKASADADGDDADDDDSAADADSEADEPSSDADSDSDEDEDDDSAEGSEDSDSDDEDEDEDEDEDGDEDAEGDEADEDEEPAAQDDGPSGPIAYRYFGTSDVGLVREHNEDNFTVVDLTSGDAVWGGDGDDASPPEDVTDGEVPPKGMIFAVCDGMGGAAAGEVASQMAVDTIREVMLDGKVPSHRDGFAHRLVYAIEEAGSRIFSAAKMDRSRRGMGTTATVAGLVDRILFVGQVGDSRCYVLRAGELSLITKDQSLVNQLIEAGQLTEEEAEAFEHSNIILQALGTTEEVTVDLTFMEVRQGDRIMLCSDGLSGLVHNEMIKEVMADGDDLEAIAARLVEMANAGGGHDNITCVVADLTGEGLSPLDGAPTPVYQQYPLPPIEEVDEDLPRREPTIKTGGRKPGADVKHITYDPGAPEVPTATFPWPMVIVATLLVAVVLAIVLTSNDPPPDEPVVVEQVQEPEPVEVCVQTDVVDGELFVDDQAYGPLTEGDDVCVELAPGAYRFEARVGGSPAAHATLTVREGVPADVELRLPEGAMRADDDAGLDDGAVPDGDVDAGEPDAGAPDAGPTTMVGPTMTTMTTTMTGTTMTGTTMTGTTMTGTTMTTTMTGTMTTTMTGTTMTTTMTGTTMTGTTMTTTMTGTTMTGTTMTDMSNMPENPF